MTDHVELALEHLKSKLEYQCGDMLGKGTYGSVYKVTTPDYDVYAAKIVEHRAVNEMEVIIWPKLKNKNVLKLFGIIELENVFIFLTDLMATNLFLRLQSREFKEDPKAIERCQTYARQVLTGLSYLHRHKLCHLDLRSENVFLAAEDDRAVVADFSGLSWSDSEKNFCPLPHSLRPPEMLTSKKKRVAPMPIDLWSCGLLIANLFLGKGFYVCTVKHNRAGHIEAVQQYTSLFQCEIYVKKFIAETYSTSPLSYNLMKSFISMVQRFLSINPRSRLKVDDALAHPFLANCRLKDATVQEAKMAEKSPVELTIPVEDPVKDVKDVDLSVRVEPSEQFEVNRPEITPGNSKSSTEAEALQTKSAKNNKWRKYKKWWKDIGKLHFNSSPILKCIKFRKAAKTKIKNKEGRLKKKRKKANNDEIPETKQLS